MSLKILKKPRYSAMLTPYDPSFKKNKYKETQIKEGS